MLKERSWKSLSPAATAVSQQQADFLSYFDEVRTDLRSYVGALVLHTSDADDLFQELSLTLWSKFDEFDQEQSFLNWSRTFAFNAARNYWRKRKRQRRGYIDSEFLKQLSSTYKRQSEYLELRYDFTMQCIGELPPKDQEILRSFHESRVPVAQLAKLFKKPVGTICSQLSRLRERIRRCVEGKLDGQ
ncbi:sigma-70 family RNA polymerase sigma factor [Calycomorphotria hydatis]|uniref:sigma-70 family RNA polymerase sigma factor n=1 Tax=Calycomorphotria hydatis TaxID=2528027 RepID=UPI0018D26BCA|nr:sigma-70 family RNA polymerase sigma factor [Calycomorphotria hydatis]